MSELFLNACRGVRGDRPPIWIMRQAGRYLPEYREVRAKTDFLTLCRTPELAARVTLQPIERFGFDAAILFSDIMIPAEAMGIKVRFAPGPVLDEPIRTAEQIRALTTTDVRESVPYVFETVRTLRQELDDRAALIGFAAAPFTLAVYLVEGSASKSFSQVKRMLFGAPAAANELLEKLTVLTADYLQAQIDAGAQAIQLFDSWAGLLAVEEYREFSLRWVRQIMERLEPSGVPKIYFGLNSAHLMHEIAGSGADVVGVDWRTPLSVASTQLGGKFPLQGNLDPTTLFASPDVVAERTRRVIAEASSLPGHIFNLGHGILPDTPLESVEAVVRTVHGE